jgi:Tfp pilus assembly protein PilE
MLPKTFERRSRAGQIYAAGERGTTLIELLVVAIVMSVVVGGVMTLYRLSAREQDRVAGATRALLQQRVGLERMTREIRQADQVCSAYPTCTASFVNANSIDIRRCSGGSGGACTQLWVRFDCTGNTAQPVPPNVTARACMRSQSSTPGGLGSNAVPVLRDLATSSPGIFSYTHPNYLTITLRVTAKGKSKPIGLDDGVRIRNAPAS